MEKIKYKIGSFSNDGLSTGLIDVQFSETQLEEMKKIITNDFENIEVDLKVQLNRLDIYLKKNFGAIFRNEDFVKWFFDKKKINQWGENLPKITDDELLNFSKKYVEELDLKYIDISRNKSIQKSKIWIKDVSLLEELSKYLFEKSFTKDSNSFIDCLNNPDFNKKINWLGTKTLLIYLFKRLREFEFITCDFSYDSFIENSILLKGELIKNIRQSRNNTKDNNTSKPQNSDLLDEFFETVL